MLKSVINDCSVAHTHRSDQKDVCEFIERIKQGSVSFGTLCSVGFLNSAASTRKVLQLFLTLPDVRLIDWTDSDSSDSVQCSHRHCSAAAVACVLNPLEMNLFETIPVRKKYSHKTGL